MSSIISARKRIASASSMTMLRALLRLGHAGHGDLALLVALAVGPVQAHGALAAGADGAHAPGASRRTAGRSPARGRRRACCGPLRPGTRAPSMMTVTSFGAALPSRPPLTSVVPRMRRRVASRSAPVRGSRPPSMWRAKSSRNSRSALSSGCVAPGARSQKHLSEPMNQTLLGEHVEVAPARPRPSSMSSSSAAIHCSPSRQGVHQPHDSWAKNCIMLSVMPTGQVWSSSSDQRAGAEAAPDLVHRGEVRGRRRCRRRRRTASRRRPG